MARGARRAGAGCGLLGRWPRRHPRARRSPRHQRGGRLVRRHHDGAGDDLGARHHGGAGNNGGSNHHGAADHHDHLGAAGGRPGDDLWLAVAETRKLVRFDTKTKDITAEVDLAGTGCIGWRNLSYQFDQKVDPITLVGFVPGSNPELCVARLAVDGGDGEIQLQKAPLDFQVEDFQGSRLGRTLWLSMFNRSTNQSALYSFDLRRGTLEKVMSSVVDVAVAGGKVHLVHGTTEEFWGPREAGTLDDSNTLQPLDLGTEDFISGVKVYEDHLIYTSTTQRAPPATESWARTRSSQCR